MNKLSEEINSLNIIYNENLITEKQFESIKAQLLRNSNKNRNIIYSLKVTPSEILELKKQYEIGNLSKEEFELQIKRLTKSNYIFELFGDKKYKNRFLILQFFLISTLIIFVNQGRIYSNCTINNSYTTNIEFISKTTDSIYHHITSHINARRLDNEASKWRDKYPFPNAADYAGDNFLDDYQLAMETWNKNKGKHLAEYHFSELNNYYVSTDLRNSWYAKCVIDDINFGNGYGGEFLIRLYK